MKRVLTILAVLAGLSSCIYPYDPELEGTSDDIIVLEGSIVAGGTSTVRLSKVRSLSEKAYYYGINPVSGTAWVEDDQGTIYLPEDQGLAPNISIPMENASIDLKYRMKARVGDNVYSSDWLEPLSPPVIEEVTFGLSLDSTRVEVYVTMSGGEHGTGYVGLTYDETWEFHTDFEGQFCLDTLRWSVVPKTGSYPEHWCWRTARLNGMRLLNYTQLATDRMVAFPIQNFACVNNRNHKLYSINVSAFTLSEKTYKYMHNLDQISTGSGSLFSPNPGEMPSNIVCETDPGRHVEGYVTASLAASYRAFLDNRFLKHTAAATTSLFLPEGDYQEYFRNGFYPVAYMTLPVGDEGEDVSGLFWGPLRCVDCVADGGTTQKPDYWP